MRLIGTDVTAASVKKRLLETHPDKQPRGTPDSVIAARREVFENILRLRHQVLKDEVQEPCSFKHIVPVSFFALERGGIVSAHVCAGGVFIDVNVVIDSCMALPAVRIATNGMTVLLVDEIAPVGGDVPTARRINNTHDLIVRVPMKSIDDLVNGIELSPVRSLA